MIPLKDQELLRTRFAQELQGAVTLEHFTQRGLPLFVPGRQPCELCPQTRQLLEEVAALSDKIRLNIHEVNDERELAARLAVQRVPATILSGTKTDTRIRFYGIPSGYEFGALVAGILAVSGGSVSLKPETIKKLRKLRDDVHIQVFVTPTCPYCPQVAHLAHQFALVSPRVHADVIEAGEFPALSERYAVRAVPTTVINDKILFAGAVPEEAFVAQVVKATEGGPLAPASAAPSGKNVTQLGAPAGGAAPEQRPKGGGLVLP